MPRLPMIELDAMPEPLRRLVESRPPLNLYRVLANAPAAAEGFMALGSALLRQSSIAPDLRELVILRVGSLCNAAYEVHQHRKLAIKVGVAPGKIAAALREANGSSLDDAERIVLAFTDAVVHEVKAPDPLFDAVAKVLDYRQVGELILLIGFYMLVCRFLENAEVAIEVEAVRL